MWCICKLTRYPHNFEIATNHNIGPYGSPNQPSLPIPILQAHNYIDKSTQTIETKNDISDLNEIYRQLCKPSLPIPILQSHNYIDKSTQTIEEKNDTSDLDELYRQLCKACSPNSLKIFFSAMLLTQQNVDQKVLKEFPENLEKMLTDL